MKKKKQKDYLKIMIFAITFIVFYAIISDWENFKAGLFGY